MWHFLVCLWATWWWPFCCCKLTNQIADHVRLACLPSGVQCCKNLIVLFYWKYACRAICYRSRMELAVVLGHCSWSCTSSTGTTREKTRSPPSLLSQCRWVSQNSTNRRSWLPMDPMLLIRCKWLQYCACKLNL